MRKLISLFMAAALVLAVSCKKDEQKVLPAADAKTALTTGTDNIGADLEAMTNTQGYQAMSNVQNANAPFGNPMKSTMTMLKSKGLKDLKAIKGDDFDFDEAKGEWEYDDATDEIVAKAGSNVTDKVIIYFPSDSNHMDVNDATLTIYDYTSMEVIDNSYYYPDTSYLPTKIKGDIIVDGTVVLDVLFTASYTTTADGDNMPTAINATVSVTPFSLSVQYSEAGAKQTLNASIKNGSKTIVGAGVTLTYPSATDREKPDYFDGYVQIEDIKLTGNANIKALSDTTKTEFVAADFNANAKLSITRVSDGAKIGDIKAYDETDAYGDPTITPYIVFSDGTKELAKNYLSKIEDQIPADLTKN